MWWSSVKASPAKSPATLKLRDGSEIEHSELVNNIAECQTGYYYANGAFLPSGHVQTFWASQQYDDQWPIWYGRRLMHWQDGSQVSVDYAVEPPASKSEWEKDVEYRPVPNLPRFPPKTRYLRPEEFAPLDESKEPLVIHLHGLTGGSHENYVRCAISEMSKRGLQSCVLTTRGCNRTPITTPQLFNGCWTEDIRRFIAHVASASPQRSIFLIGYSLGASVLANYLGQEAENAPQQVKAAVCVANPWDMELLNYSLDTSWIGTYLYSKAMLSNLLRLVRNNRAVLEESPIFREQLEIAKSANPKVVSDFDNLYTAPLFGFDGCHDYYRTASSINRIRTIRVPLLVLHARDDPIVSEACIPWAEARANPYLHLVTTTSGGHLGWFSHKGDRWYAPVTAKYFASFRDRVDLSERPRASMPKKRWFQGDRFIVSK